MMADVVPIFPVLATRPAGLWPDPSPLPSTLPEVPQFRKELLPAELRDWVSDIADRMQVPLDFAAIPAMVAAGSLIGCRIAIRPEANTDWTEAANLWGCCVGSPGAMKSPVFSQALAPIRRLEARAAEENCEAMAEFSTAMQLHKMQKDIADKRIRSELKKGDMACATAILTELAEPEMPLPRRYVTNDATAEKLGELCAANPCGILVHRDELLTLFADLDRDEKATARGFFLSGWNGQESYTFDRIQRGTIVIPTVNISLVGTTQPSKIARYLRQSLKAHDDGMVQRLQLLAWPDFSPEWDSRDRYPDTRAREKAWGCYDRIAKLEESSVQAKRDGSDNGKGTPYLRFDPSALAAYEQYRRDLERRVRGGDLPDYFVAHLSKYRGLIPRLALIYHIASGGVGPVSEEACVAALTWSEYLEAHARRAYASMTTVDTDAAMTIVRRLKRGDLQPGFTERDVYKRNWSGLTDREQLSAALRMLEEYDWLRSERLETGGRPSVIWWPNPGILS